MRLVLIEDVPTLGDAGDVVSVKPGYGRNYLIPQGLAQLATDGRVKQLEHQRRMIEEKVQKAVAEHQKSAKQLEGVAIEFVMQSNEEGKLFGSVTNSDIQKRLAEKGLEVERRKIQTEALKQLGEHDVKIRLHRDVEVSLKVTIVSSGEPPPPPVEEEQSQAELAMDEAEVIAQRDERE
jgi:large subunit ribosomal protein L9